MPPDLDRYKIAERIRGLMNGQDRGSIAATAERLYDATTHHLALDEDRAGVAEAMRLVAQKATPPRGSLRLLDDSADRSAG